MTVDQPSKAELALARVRRYVDYWRIHSRSMACDAYRDLDIMADEIDRIPDLEKRIETLEDELSDAKAETRELLESIPHGVRLRQGEW